MSPPASPSPDTPDITAPEITVIVPVYNHWPLVPALLACLDAQRLDQARFELLLVDNGSDWIPDDLALPSWARLLHCPEPGSYAARNAALAEARGWLVAFTDADCRPGPRWLAEALAHFRQAGSSPGLLAGGIAVEPADWARMTPSEIYDVALGLPQARYVRRGYAITANLFVPLAVFAQVGRFDARRYSGGDAEFCRRAGARGIPLHYREAAGVVHPARREWAELETKKRRVKGGQIRNGRWPRRVAYALRTLLPPFDIWLRALAAPRLSVRQRLLACAMHARLWRVELAELARLLVGHTPVRR